MWIKRQIPHIVNNIIVSFVVSLRILSFNWLSAVLSYWAYTVTLHSQYLAFESTRKGLKPVVGPSHPPRRRHQTRSRTATNAVPAEVDATGTGSRWP